MNRLLISTAIAGLLACGGTAWAQGPDDHRPPEHAAHAPAAPHMAPTPKPGPVRQAPAHQLRPQNAPHNNAMRGPAPNNAMRGPAPGNAMRGPAPNNAMRGPAPSHGAPGNARANFSSFQRNFSAPRQYHAPAYHPPHGWYARRWTYGQILPSLFWAQDYWLNDYVDYGLMAPPPGTVWVRDGNDALLIDQSSGEIIQVEYGVFY